MTPEGAVISPSVHCVGRICSFLAPQVANLKNLKKTQTTQKILKFSGIVLQRN